MSATPDFKALFTLSPNPSMVLDRELRFVAANEAYLRVTASRLEELLGRYLFDVFPHDSEDPNNRSARLLHESLSRVLASHAPDTLALISYRVPRQTPAGVIIEERFWSATHTPILDEEGQVAFILQHTVDVTELHQLKQALSAAATRGEPAFTDQMEAGQLRRAQLVQEANSLLDSERRHLRILLVEDDEDIRLSAAELMQEMGHFVRDVPTAEAAQEALAKEPFDVLFTDVSLPGMSGLELARQAVRQHPGLHVLVASGHDLERDTEAIVPGTVLLPKPYTLEQLQSALARVS